MLKLKLQAQSDLALLLDTLQPRVICSCGSSQPYKLEGSDSEFYLRQNKECVSFPSCTDIYSTCPFLVFNT